MRRDQPSVREGEPEKPQPPDPLEEALVLIMPFPTEKRALAAIRVLARGHIRSYFDHSLCSCGVPEPCPVLAEAAEALRGGK